METTDDLFEHARVAEACVVGREDERDGASLGPRGELAEERAGSSGCELSPVATREFGPALGSVPVPTTERVARREFLGPRVELGRLLFEPAWPKPLDEHAIAVTCVRWLVRSLELHHARSLRPRRARHNRECIGEANHFATTCQGLRLRTRHSRAAHTSRSTPATRSDASSRRPRQRTPTRPPSRTMRLSSVVRTRSRS